MTELVRYEAARRALAEAKQVDEVLDVRNQAERMKLYARQAKDRDLLADATEIHLRAERQLGLMLAEAKASGQIGRGQPPKNSSGPEEFSRVRLSDVGIDHKLSMRAQRTASIAEQAFEIMVDRTRERIAAGAAIVIDPLRDLTTQEKQERRAARERVLGACQQAMPEIVAGVILEDFEWDFEVWGESGKTRHPSNHYPTSDDAHTAEEIVARTADRFAVAAPDCVLFMWATVPHLAVALDVLRLRGFRYVTNFNWGKDRISTGYWNRNKHEHLLVGVRGTVPAPAPGTQWESDIRADVREHSRKPDWQYELIESYFPTLPKIELNARHHRAGWIQWGNEAPVIHDPETGEIMEAAE